MAIQKVEIIKEFGFSVEKLYSFLAEHENLEKIFPLTSIKRVSDGIESRNGVGSSRKIRVLFGFPFIETITFVIENKVIEYRITKGSPLKNHIGKMEFSTLPGGGCKLHYTIEFEGKFLLIGEIVKILLDRGIRDGLNGLQL